MFTTSVVASPIVELPRIVALRATLMLPSRFTVLPLPVLTAMLPTRLMPVSVIVRSAAAPVFTTRPLELFTVIASASPFPSVTVPLRLVAPVTVSVELSAVAPETERPSLISTSLLASLIAPVAAMLSPEDASVKAPVAFPIDVDADDPAVLILVTPMTVNWSVEASPRSVLPFTVALPSTEMLPSIVTLFAAPVLTAMFPFRMIPVSVIVRSAAAPVFTTRPPVPFTVIASASPLPRVTAPLRLVAPVT